MKNELFTVVTNVLDPEELSALDVAEAYHEWWEIELTFDELETPQRGGAVVLRERGGRGDPRSGGKSATHEVVEFVPTRGRLLDLLRPPAGT